VLFLVVLGSETGLFEPLYAWVDERPRGQVGGPSARSSRICTAAGPGPKIARAERVLPRRTGSGQRYGAPASVASEAAG